MTNFEKNVKLLKETMAHKHKHTLMHVLGIEITELGIEKVCGTMPVDERTHQYYGMLHGGASVVLAETLCSCAAFLHINPETHKVVGLEINANHIKGIKSGIVTGEARPVHLGKRTQVWQIDIKNEKQEMVCVSRCTIAVIENK